MHDVLYFKWKSYDCTTADTSVSIWIDSTVIASSMLYTGSVLATNDGFFYSIGPEWYLDMSSLYANIGAIFLNNDPVSAYVDLTNVGIEENEYGQKCISTGNYADITMGQETVTTINTVFLDRTEGSGIVFFEMHDTTGLDSTTFINETYSYDTEPALTDATLYTTDSTGYFKLYRETNLGEKGIDGVVIIYTTAYTNPAANLRVYIDYTHGADTTGQLVGAISPSDTANSAENRFTFNIPRPLMEQISDSYFTNLAMSLDNTRHQDTTQHSYYGYRIYDTYVSYTPLFDSSCISESTASVYDSTYLLHWNDITTSNYARIKRGNSYILDYYTPTEFWGMSTTSRVYTYEDINKIERIVSYFGRFGNSLLKFDKQLPEVITMKLAASAASNDFTILEDYADTTTEVGKLLSNGYEGFYLTPYVSSSNELKLYAPNIMPNNVVDDGTTYTIVPYIYDNTCFFAFYHDATGTYDFWSNGEAEVLHPLTEDNDFYISMYGKR